MLSHRTRQIIVGLVETGLPDDALPGRLLTWCLRTLPVDGAAFVRSSPDEGAPRVLATAGPAAAGLADLQLALGEGPCGDAARSGRSVLAPDVARERRRWPAFAPGALDLGARAVFSLPLRADGTHLGTLALHRDVPGPLVDGDFAEALSFADAATALLRELPACGAALPDGR